MSRSKQCVLKPLKLDRQPVEPDTVEIKVRVDREQFVRLTHLANAKHERLPQLLSSLLDRLDEAIVRSGSWERAGFELLFGEALDVANQAMYAAGDEPKLKGGAV